MSNKKVKGKMLQVLIEAKKKKNPGPQGINRGGRQPKMDFKGKPMGYFENRRSSTNNKVPLAQKGPHGQGQGRGGGTQRGKQGINFGGRRPMVVRDKNPPQKLAVIQRGNNKGQGGVGKIAQVIQAAMRK